MPLFWCRSEVGITDAQSVCFQHQPPAPSALNSSAIHSFINCLLLCHSTPFQGFITSPPLVCGIMEPVPHPNVLRYHPSTLQRRRSSATPTNPTTTFPLHLAGPTSTPQLNSVALSPEALTRANSEHEWYPDMPDTWLNRRKFLALQPQERCNLRRNSR